MAGERHESDVWTRLMRRQRRRIWLDSAFFGSIAIFGAIKLYLLAFA